jgi:hypothetical protein
MAPIASWLLPFASDPFTDVRGAVPELDTVRFGKCQQCHSAVVDQVDLPEIDGDGAAFLSDRATKDVNIVPSNAAADAEHHKISLCQQSIDSAGHDDLTVCVASRAPIANY